MKNNNAFYYTVLGLSHLGLGVVSLFFAIWFVPVFLFGQIVILYHLVKRKEYSYQVFRWKLLGARVLSVLIMYPIWYFFVESVLRPESFPGWLTITSQCLMGIFIIYGNLVITKKNKT